MSKRYLSVLALLVATPAFAQLSGTAILTASPAAGGQFNDTIVLHNTGTTTIGTFWLGWIPGEDFLPSEPTAITAPLGWYGYAVPDFYGTYSLEFYAYSPAYYLPAGGSLTGFGFTTFDSPQTLQGISTEYPRYHCTDSYLYIGSPEADPGFLFNVSVQTGSTCGSADYNCDGDVGTDADIEAFFACLAGNCPAAPCTSNADFNGDGDVGTDADIEAFFRVLAGGAC